MNRELRKYFWWNNMKRVIIEYVNQCLICSKIKAENQRPLSELRSLKILTWKLDLVSMDFVMELPLSISNKNGIWVIPDQLTKFTHFLPIQDIQDFQKLAQLYVKEIVSIAWNYNRHSVIQGPQITSSFLTRTSKSLWNKIKFQQF